MRYTTEQMIGMILCCLLALTFALYAALIVFAPTAGAQGYVRVRPISGGATVTLTTEANRITVQRIRLGDSAPVLAGVPVEPGEITLEVRPVRGGDYLQVCEHIVEGESIAEVFTCRDTVLVPWAVWMPIGG